MCGKYLLRLGILSLWFVLSASLSYGVDRYVDAVTGADSSNNGSSSSPYKTITYAVTNNTGSKLDPLIINVKNGPYNTSLGETFPIILKQDTTLLGSGASKVTVDAGSPVDPTTPVLAIIGQRVIIKGLTVSNANIGILAGTGGYTIQDMVFAADIIDFGISHRVDKPNLTESYVQGNILISSNEFKMTTDHTPIPAGQHRACIYFNNEIEFDGSTTNLEASLGTLTIEGNSFDMNANLKGIQMAQCFIRDMGSGNRITAGNVYILDNTFKTGTSGVSLSGINIGNITATSGVDIGEIAVTGNDFSLMSGTGIWLSTAEVWNHKTSGHISIGKILVEQNTIENAGEGIFIRQYDVSGLDGTTSTTSSGINVSDNEIKSISGKGIALDIYGSSQLSDSSRVSLGKTTISNNDVTASSIALKLDLEDFLSDSTDDSKSSLETVEIRGNTLEGSSAIVIDFDDYGVGANGNASAELGRFTIADNALTATGSNPDSNYGIDISFNEIGYDDMEGHTHLSLPEVVVQNNSITTSNNLTGLYFYNYDSAYELTDSTHINFGSFQVKNNVFNPDKEPGKMGKGIYYRNTGSFYEAMDTTVVSYDPVEISGNTFYNMTETAIEVQWSDIAPNSSVSGTPSFSLPNLLVTKNNIDGADTGIKYSLEDITHRIGNLDLGSITFKDNILQNVQGNAGIMVLATQVDNAAPTEASMSMGKLSINNNTLSHGGGAGISLSLESLGGDGITVSRRTVSGNIVSDFQRGIHFENVVGTSTVSCNTLEDNTSNGFNITGNNNGPLTLLHNSFLNNNSYGLMISTTATVDARKNWWGDAAGPAVCTNCNKTYATGGGSISFDPWLTSAPVSQCANSTILLFMPAILNGSMQ